MDFIRNNIIDIIAFLISIVTLGLTLVKIKRKDQRDNVDEIQEGSAANGNGVKKIRGRNNVLNITQQGYQEEIENEYKAYQSRRKLTSIIIISCTVISLVSIVAVVCFELVSSAGKNITESVPKTIEEVMGMQSITLTITGIAISMIALISTMLTTNREEKFARMEQRLDKQAERITKENEEISQQRKDNREMLEEVRKNAEQITDIVVAQTAFLENTKIRWLKSMTSRSPIYVKYIYLQMIYDKCRKDDISEARQIEYCKMLYDEGNRCLVEYNKGQNEEFGYDRSPEVVLLEIMIADVTLTMARKVKPESEDEYRETIARFEEAEKRFKDILGKYEYPDDDGYVNNGLGLVKYWRYMCEKRHNGKAAESLLDAALDFYGKAIAFGDKYEFYSNIGVVYSQKWKLRVAEKYDALKKAYKEKIGGEDLDEQKPSILMYKIVQEDEERLKDYLAKEKECDKLLEDSKENYMNARKRSKMAVTPWINLAGACIDNIRQLMMLDEECVILSSVLFMKNNKKYIDRVDESVENNYNQAKIFLERAQDCDSFKIDCYFKAAQLKCYYILYLRLKGKDITDTEIVTLKKEIEEDFARCDEINITCISSRNIKRMYYDVIDEFGEARKVDKLIVKEGVSLWSIAFDNYMKAKQML